MRVSLKFGTDGVRGRAPDELTVELVESLESGIEALLEPRIEGGSAHWSERASPGRCVNGRGASPRP